MSDDLEKSTGEFSAHYSVKPMKETARQAYIEEYNIRFLRFTADDVENNLDEVIQKIAATI